MENTPTQPYVPARYKPSWLQTLAHIGMGIVMIAATVAVGYWALFTLVLAPLD